MSQESRWNNNYQALLAFVEREGHALVPADHVEGGTVLLGNWVAHQRQKQRRGSLPERHAALLAALPGWQWGPLGRGPRRDVERDGQMVTLCDNGLSLQQVADRFGVSRQRVHQIVQRARRSQCV